MSRARAKEKKRSGSENQVMTHVIFYERGKMRGCVICCSNPLPFHFIPFPVHKKSHLGTFTLFSSQPQRGS